MSLFAPISRWIYPLVFLPLVIGVSGWQGVSWWHWATSAVVPSTETTQQDSIQLEVASGTSTRQIGSDLQATGMIHSALAWNLWAFWLGMREQEGGFQAGVYAIAPTQSMLEIAQKIWQGEVQQQQVTIPEGWSVREMGAEFERLQYFSQAEFMKAAAQIPPDSSFAWVPQDLPLLEGFLYPETYALRRGVTPQEVVALMLTQFQKVALPLYEAQRSQTDLNLQEWVTLASLVEKEAAIAQERPRIAGVFLNRLQRGMKLESDPTVEYGLGIKQTPDQPLTFDQVSQPFPHNTYRNPGLPPTPIASPGGESLKAVLNPEKTDFLYFVARYDGTHVFSRTQREHETAKRTIRQERERQLPKTTQSL